MCKYFVSYDFISGSVYMIFYQQKWNFISVKVTAMKQHTQRVLFRIASCKQLQEIDQTPKNKYLISPEMKSHVNTLTICIFDNLKANNYLIVWYHILIFWKWVDFFVDLLNLMKLHSYLTQLKTILSLLRNGRINGKQILMTLTTKKSYTEESCINEKTQISATHKILSFHV